MSGPAARRKSGAFSLVEVVLALGIVSFCALALLGLFSVGLRNDRQSSDDTYLGTMASWIAGDLRTAGTTLAGGTNFSFDNQGQPLTNGDASSYYACQVTTGSSQLAGASTNLVWATLTFTWPASVPASRRPFTNTVYATFPSP